MGFSLECSRFRARGTLVVAAIVLTGLSGAAAAASDCTAWKRAIAADVVTRGTKSCPVASVQSVRFSGDRITVATQMADAYGAMKSVVASASIRDLHGDIPSFTQADGCNNIERHLPVACMKGACVTQIDNRTVPATRTQVGGLAFIVTDHAAPSSIDQALRRISQNRCAIGVAPLVTLPLRGGGTLDVADFIHDPRSIPDYVNHGRILLSGALGYCLPDGRCKTGDALEMFDLFYSPQDGQFNIDLKKAPLEWTRQDATLALMARLNIKPEIACQLKIFVRAMPGIDARFAANVNLGLSFCPDAKVLK